MMRARRCLGFVVLFAAGCGGSSSDNTGAGGTSGSGGSSSMDSGGSSTTGGEGGGAGSADTGAGATTSTGGISGSGGRVGATGGRLGSGGSVATGGAAGSTVAGTGGKATGGAITGTGGTTTGGAAGSGGKSGTGGASGQGGAVDGGAVTSAGNPDGSCSAGVPAKGQPVDTSAPTTVVGTGSGTCTFSALKAATTKGGIITFDCGPDPVTIPVTATLNLPTNKNTVIDGGNKITLDGGNAVQILRFDSPDFQANDNGLTLQHITLINGKTTPTQAIPTAPAPCSQGWDDGEGGAVYMRDGNMVVIDSIFMNNQGGSAWTGHGWRCHLRPGQQERYPHRRQYLHWQPGQ